MDTPRTDLVAEANHRAANSLALLAGLVRMQAKASQSRTHSPAEIRMMFDGIAARIATVGQLHRLLAGMTNEGAVMLNLHLKDICDTLVQAFSSEQRLLHVQHSGSDCLGLTKHVQPLTLIICEVLTNAMKYAHPAGNVPVVMTVDCQSRADGTLIITICDDGVGLPDGFDTEKDGGIGFQLIRGLVAETGGALEISSDTLGTSFKLTVPQALVANAKSA